MNKKIVIDPMTRIEGHLRFVTRLEERIEQDLDTVEPGVLAFVEQPVPRNARGVGLTEATRGALGHWIETDDKGYISNYELIVPTTWNISAAPKNVSKCTQLVIRSLLISREASN